MRAHVLLNLLNELSKRYQMRGLYDINIILKSFFSECHMWDVKMSFHNVSQKSVNH